MPRQVSLKTIEARIRELQTKAEMLRRAEAPGISQLRAVVRKYKLTAADIAHALSDSRARRRNPLKGQKVKPKYRNPENRSETWSGRGLRPRWLVSALKSGKKLEHFAI